MRWFDSVLAWLFPSLLVEGTPWSHLWNEKERESFLVGARLCFPILAALYVGHYYFFDKPNGLEPPEFWFWFRVAIATCAAVTFVFYISPCAKWAWYRAPATVTLWLVVMAQADIALWYGHGSWVFCYVLLLASALVLRMSALKTLLFVGFSLATTTPILRDAGIERSLVFTWSTVTTAIALLVRANYLSDVRSFLLSQENIAAQKRIIELNLEFADRIRSFIPRIIAERIDAAMDQHRMSVIEASVDVLVPRTKKVACLFSDIRGYTQGSRELDAFIKESVIPEVRACTDAVEDCCGIPRKIGDLLFAYFDDDSMDRNLLNCIAAGMTVSRLNHDMNATVHSKLIRRYVLVSCGEALVGNLGGFDSSIEITALGSPVNLLSRVDEITKAKQVSELLKPGDLVLSAAASHRLGQLAPGLAQKCIDLRKLGVIIRDFGEETSVFSVAPNDANHDCLLRAIDDFRRKTDAGRGSQTVAA